MRWGAAVLNWRLAMALIVGLGLGLTGVTAPAFAQDGSRDTRIPPQSFLALKEGRTLAYRLPDGSLWGREYWPNQDRTVWQDPDGSCMICEVERVGQQLCFDCQNGARSCWQHFEEPGGRIRILSDAGGEAFGRDIGSTPPACGSPNS